MKKFLALSLIGTSLFIGSSPLKADSTFDYWGLKRGGNKLDKIEIYTINSTTGVSTLKGEFCKMQYFDACYFLDSSDKSFIDDSGTLNISLGGYSKYIKYDPDNNTFSDGESKWRNNYSDLLEKPILSKDDTGNISIGDDLIKKKTSGEVQIGRDTDDIDIVTDGLNIDGAAVITKNADGSIQIGADGNDIDLTSEGLTVDGISLITKKNSGEIHIGKNSLITIEEDGVQKLYAKDENGDAININVTEGTKLLIDGVEVQTGNSTQVTTNKNNISTNTSNISTNTSNISTNTSNISTNTSNIKNLGSGVAGSTALTAALTALPQTSKESKLSCGVGSGAYSSRYAIGFGCASKVNERVDINAGGSYVFGGSKSYGEGTLDSGVVKAGFVFKLGELKKPTQISIKDKKVMETKIETLEEKNKQLLARLERLEKIALGESKSLDLAVYQLK